MRSLIVVGAGGFGRAVADAANAGGCWQVVGFVDDRGRALGTVDGLPVLGCVADLPGLRRDYMPRGGADLVVAIGNNAARRHIATAARAAGFALATVVHPNASVSRLARIGEGSIVMAGAVVGTGAVLGAGTIVNAGAVVDHDATVGDHGHLAVGACMAGGAALPALARLSEGEVLSARGTGSNVRQSST